MTNVMNVIVENVQIGTEAKFILSNGKSATVYDKVPENVLDEKIQIIIKRGDVIDATMIEETPTSLPNYTKQRKSNIRIIPKNIQGYALKPWIVKMHKIEGMQGQYIQEELREILKKAKATNPNLVVKKFKFRDGRLVPIQNHQPVDFPYS